jgi:indole-3-acetate monooxygenase
MTDRLEAARALAPRIVELAPDTERARELPTELFDGLRTAGVFRMYVPRSHGGDELMPDAVVPVIEELARADGSVGWIATIGVNAPAIFAYLPPAAYDAVYADGPDVFEAGSLIPRGRAVRTDSGFRFTGQWPFASGCTHADYIGFHARVEAPNGDDAPGGGPPAGRPPSCFAVVPVAEVEIVDTWHVSGLRGTGSHDVAAHDLFVADEWTGNLTAGPPIVRHPLDAVPALGRLGLELAAVAVGIARGAVDDLVEIASTKRPLAGILPRSAEDPVFQYHAGEIALDLRIARLLLHDIAASDGARVSAGRALEARELIERRAMLGRIGRMAASVVDRCYAACGTTGLHESSPLQRRMRDVHAVIQHVLFTRDALGPAGAYLLGEPVSPGLF